MLSLVSLLLHLVVYPPPLPLTLSGYLFPDLQEQTVMQTDGLWGVKLSSCFPPSGGQITAWLNQALCSRRSFSCLIVIGWLKCYIFKEFGWNHLITVHHAYIEMLVHLLVSVLLKWPYIPHDPLLSLDSACFSMALFCIKSKSKASDLCFIAIYKNAQWW